MTRTRTVLTALALAGLIATPAIVPPAKAADNSFGEALSKMVKSQDSSDYFDCMNLTIGSNLMSVNGMGQIMDASPSITNGRTMLPIRAIAEAAGAEVDYDAATKSAIIRTNTGVEIRCPIGADYMLVDGKTVQLDSPSYVSGGRTYLPVRAVSEAMDLQVDWNGMTSTVSISAPYQTCRVIAWAPNGGNVSGLGAKQTISDGTGLWVMQFDTPAQAKTAVNTLTSRGVIAQADAYIPPVDDAQSNTSASASGSHHSWGATDCSFDEFISNNNISSKGSGTVAVVDTGVDATHSFLQGHVLAGYDYVDGDDDASDENYHGTHVAGTILDCCSGTNVNILPVRVLDENGSGSTANVVAGIKYAADNGADVINLSLGGPHGANCTTDAAIEYAVSKGVLVVVAAGNDNDDTETTCPAHMTLGGVVVVTAGDSSHKKASFSNYGANADLMAPGVAVEASVPGNSYKKLNGTSMATPHAAAAGMLLDLATNKSLSPADLKTQLQQLTNGSGSWQDQYVGYGFLDLSGSTPSPTPNPSTITGYRYNVSTLDLEVGKSFQITVTAVLSDGTYRDVTAQSALTSTNTSVVSVGKDGVISGKATGSAEIAMSVTPFDLSIPTPIHVNVVAAGTQPSGEYIRLFWALGQKTDSSTPVTLSQGATMQVQLKGEKEDHSIDDLTTRCKVYSSNPSVLQLNGTQLTAVAPGEAYLYYSSAPNVGLTLAPLLQFVVQ